MRATFTVAAGERVGFAMRWVAAGGARARAARADEVAARIEDTVEAWRSWEAEHDVYEGPHRELVRLSSRVLKGLTYRPTGAIVAAPTTSLPETVGGERNWDYRYAWIRDASLTLEALYIGACSDEAEEFVSFMTSSAGGRASERSLQIMYGIAGEHDLTERELPHLRGWRDSAPVRVGNGAWGQTQLDVYGELLNSLHLYRDRLGDLAPGDPAIRRRPRRHRRAALARDRRRHVGDARRAAPSPLEQGALLGGARPCDRARAAARDPRRRRALDRRARRDPRGGAHARLERGTASLRAVIRLRRSRRRAAADADPRLPACHRRADALDDRCDRRRSHRGRSRAALPKRGGPQRRRPHRRGGDVRDLLVLARVRAGQGRRDRPRRAAVRQARRPTPTTSDCWPRRSTRPPANCWATSRRRSATSA